MRILYNSKEERFKSPFGTLTPEQPCTLHLHIPVDCRTSAAEVIFDDCNGKLVTSFSMKLEQTKGDYDIFTCQFSLSQCGLYFYYFRINAHTGPFRLFRQGNDTNMEAGEKWQLSCIPADFKTPDWSKGAVMYQIFPDRFYQVGTCDTTGKLGPFWMHEDLSDMPNFRPDAHGEVLNNDFFGGNFRGIQEKLPYLKSLGVGVLYLNPIVKAFSNHRYDAADFKCTDPMLGTQEDFRDLCDAAHRLGIRVIFDGVFNHTGSNSIYFDAKGVFGGGAVSDPDSKYRSWFQFKHYPDEYLSWWGIQTLPCVDKSNPDYIRYLVDDEDSVIAHWMKLGVDGFRLDVVDELPNELVVRLKQRVRELNPEGMLIGEVWEDASNKIAYDVSRRYFVDAELDSVMNYPWQKAIIQYITGKDDGSAFGECVMTIAENYPPQVLACVMNILGTHDTARILNTLATDFRGNKEQQSRRELTDAERERGLRRLLLASVLQYTLPGMPCVYYGDEAGMEGFADPFNRRYFPWGKENTTLQAHYRALGQLKNQTPALQLGDVRVQEAGGGRVCFVRRTVQQTVAVCVNHAPTGWQLPVSGEVLFATEAPSNGVLPANSAAVLERPKQ